MAKILVADDEPSIREIIKLTLEKEGHTVSLAQDGSIALAMMSNASYDLLITDILMPNKDGIELAVEVRDKFDTIPVIAISGGRRNISSDFNLTSANMVGVNEVLKKPFQSHTLINAVKKILG